MSEVRERLACFPDIVERLDTLRAELEWVAREEAHATLAGLWGTYGAHAGRYLPLSLAPILDSSLVAVGVAVGWHTTPPNTAPPAGLQDYAGRFLMGQLIHAAKQYDTTMWSTDSEDVQAIGSLAAFALASTRFGRQVDLIAAVPSSRGANSLPWQIARDLAFLTHIRYAPVDAIRFDRQVPQVKAIRDSWAKREVLAGSMSADPDAMRSRNVLLVDDVCRTGATFHECARACRDAGAVRVTALAASKTWDFQRIPAESERSHKPWSAWS